MSWKALPGRRRGQLRPQEGGAAAADGRRFRFRIYPFEAFTWAAVAAAVLFLRSRGLRIDWRTVEYTLFPMIPVTGKALLWGVGLVAAYRLLRRQPLIPYLKAVATPGWLLLWLRLWVACMLMTYAYFWLKVSVPLVNERLWDDPAWWLDVALHFGLSPSVFLAELLGGTPVLRWLDVWYSWWLTTVFFAIAFFSAFPGAAFRRRFMASCILIWTLGAWLYVAVPVLGPIYRFPEAYAGIRGEIPRAEAAQLLLWENYEKVAAGRTRPLRRFNPTRGIAAMPSLHVGVHWLLMLWAWRRARPLLLPFALANLFTLVGSVATGWHYAVDGYAGILLAHLCFWATRRWEGSGEADAEEERREEGEAAPGEGGGGEAGAEGEA